MMSSFDDWCVENFRVLDGVEKVWDPFETLMFIAGGWWLGGWAPDGHTVASSLLPLLPGRLPRPRAFYVTLLTSD